MMSKNPATYARQKGIAQACAASFMAITAFFSVLAPALADTANTLTTPAPTQVVDPSQSGFKLIVCDGPDLRGLPSGTKIMFNGKEVTTTQGQNPTGYVACDFNGLMIQVQHFINIAMVVGVFAAIAGFCYMGWLFISGTQANRQKAKDISLKIVVGFIIMLSAWFIVYQILSWLTTNAGFQTLIGSK